MIRLLRSSLIHCGIIFCIFSSGFAQTPLVASTTRAVIVGISKYNDTNIERLRYASKDAQDYYNFLLGPLGGNVPKENITLLLDSSAKRKNIIVALREAFRETNPNDVIIFFYSGHGRTGSNSSGFLSTYDTENSEIDGTALSMSALEGFLSKPSRIKYTFIDACHAGLQAKSLRGNLHKTTTNSSGTLENKKLSNSLQAYLDLATGTYITMLSSQDSQESIESEALKNGVFTHFLIKGLSGEADKFLKNTSNYNDGRITARELSRYLEDRVTEYTKEKQIPAFGGAYSSSETMANLRTSAPITTQAPIDESYNEILETKFYPNVKGYVQHSNSSNFEMECPTDTVSNYIDLRAFFFEPKLVDKLEHLRLTVTKVEKDKIVQLFEQYYAVRPGLNKFRIRNFLRQKGVVITLGYQLKSEMNKPYPSWETVICKLPARK